MAVQLESNFEQLTCGVKTKSVSPTQNVNTRCGECALTSPARVNSRIVLIVQIWLVEVAKGFEL